MGLKMVQNWFLKYHNQLQITENNSFFGVKSDFEPKITNFEHFCENIPFLGWNWDNFENIKIANLNRYYTIRIVRLRIWNPKNIPANMEHALETKIGGNEHEMNIR